MGEAVSPVRANVVRERPLARRAWRVMQAAIGAGIGGITLGALLRLPDVAVVAYAASAVTIGVSALTSFAARLARPDFRSAEKATASGEGLRLDDGTFVPAGAMTQAIVTPRRAAEQPWIWKKLGIVPDVDRYDVEIQLAGRFAWPLRFSTRTLEEARAMVEALGLGVGQRAVTRKVMSPFVHPRRTFPLIFGGMGLAFLGGILSAVLDTPAFAAFAAALPLGIVTVYTFGLIKTKVTIGADGVSVRWLGKPRTIPLTEIARVEVIPAGFATAAVVRLHRKSGPPFDIEVGLRGGNPFEPFILSDEVALIAERIREAMSLREKAEPVEFRIWAANKADLPTGDWIAMLRGALDAYRDEGTMPFSRTDLWAIVENARAHPAERAAAVVAVSHGADEAQKTRLRNVAASTALPRFRVVCEAAAAGDDDALRGALETLRAEAPPEVPVETPKMRVEAEPTGAAEDEESARAAAEERAR